MTVHGDRPGHGQVPHRMFTRFTPRGALTALFCACLASCSPEYVLRGGWEEAAILSDPQLTPPQREALIAVYRSYLLENRSDG